jgi:hypothetical protein
MIRFRRRGLAVLGAVVLSGASVAMVPAMPVSAAPRALAAVGTPFAQASFGAYGTGSEISLKAVTLGATTLAGVEQAFSANTAASGGLKGVVASPVTGALVQTDQTANNANAYGRGSGAEVGLGLTTAQKNQIQLGIAEAHAAPPSGLITKTAIPLNIPGLLTTGLLTGRAAAAYNSQFCPVGQPLAYGEGEASAPTSVVGSSPPVVSGTGASGTQAAQTTTRTDLVANADGTFGIQNTVKEIITPLTVNLGTALQIAVTVQGADANNPFSISTFNDGEGHAGVKTSNGDPVITIALKIGAAAPITLASVKRSLLAGIINPLLGSSGTLHNTLALLGINLSVDVGATISPTATSVAYDLLAINASIPAAGITVANVRVGHVESSVMLPNGPIACTVPVAKVASAPTVAAGNSFTWTILIPSSAAALSDSTCDLVHIHATDKISINSGSPSFTIGTISNGGVYNTSTGTITWADLGTYHPGTAPIQLTVMVSIPANSPNGVLADTANVTAGLGNCTGGASGEATAIGAVDNAIIGGSITLIAPAVTASGNNLATTGSGPTLPWIAVGLLVMAEGTRRLLRRARTTS